MLVPMTKARILGRSGDVERVLARLHDLGLVEIVDARDTKGLRGLDGETARSARREDLEALLNDIRALLSQLPGGPGTATSLPPAGQQLALAETRTEVRRLTTRVDDIDRRLAALNDEHLILTGHLKPLRKLLKLVPVLAELDADKLGVLGLATVALVLNTEDEQLPEALRDELQERLGDRFELASTKVEAGAIGCLVVFPQAARDAVQAMLGRAAVRSVALPNRFGRLSLHQAVDAMQHRLGDIRDEVEAAEQRRQVLLMRHARQLADSRRQVQAELDLVAAEDLLGSTGRTFCTECWVPRPRLEELHAEVARWGPTVVLAEAHTSRHDTATPVLMQNSRLWRPLESLVRFLGLPRSGSVDPTLLMAVLLPLMLGSMVGDVGYGLALLVLALVARRRLATHAARMPEVRALLSVMLLGAAWSMVFGLLYGEFLGDLGNRLVGDFAVWRYRPSAGALQPLLVFAVVLGAAHVVLGLALGAWQALHSREHRLLLDKLGTLLALGGLFGLAGWAVDQLPDGAVTPSVGVVVVGLVLVMSLHGLLGIVTGLLDLLGTLGNILSYLRLAAVGLASAHLAGVANELGSVGPLWLGVLVAAFFHALNLALASFSPLIQSLRLQYVEFFGAFFIGGGRAFEPFGRRQAREIPSAG